jgi:hypothetical protein
MLNKKLMVALCWFGWNLDWIVFQWELHLQKKRILPINNIGQFFIGILIGLEHMKILF